MPARPARWCGRCSEAHAGQCPQFKPFERKRAGNQSGRGGYKWTKLREQVFELDQYLCRPCRKKGKLTAVALHGRGHGICGHIIPVADGGSDDISNLQTECQACSREKTQLESAMGRGGQFSK